ncbi:hypothetical protein PRNP1_012017 [Phytophthora ramorum]
MGARASAFIWPYADIQYGFLDRELGIDNLHALAAQGRHRAVRKLLRKGLDPNGRRLEGASGAEDDERGDSPMICATRGVPGNKDQKRHVKTLEVLLHFGAKVNQPNLLNQTPLYIACEGNVVRVATWLLQHDADVNINCKTGISPLMCAYRNQNVALATLILEKGAVVIRPPATFSYIRFPELADELGTLEAPANDKSATVLHSALQQYIDREAERRARVLEDAHEAQRLEDQRLYREQLANEGAKRKARRRRKRLEAQQRRNLPPVKALGTAVDTSEIERGDASSRSANQGDGLLLWEKKAMSTRIRSAASGRPKWVPRRIYCTQDHRKESEHDFMHQCKKLNDSLELERSRRLSVRSVAAAPAYPGHLGRHELPCDTLWASENPTQEDCAVMPGRVSQHHQEELGKFLKFFRSRLKTHLENVEADFEDTRSDRLSSEEVYSQKDIQEAIKSLCFAVKANIRSELQDTINMMALLLRQIFMEAEDSELALDLDIAMVEDKELLERVEQLSVSEWTSGDSRGAAAIGALPRNNAKAQADVEAKEKLEKRLQHEQEQHEDEIRAAKLTSKQELAALEAAHTKELRKMQRKIEQANERVEELERQVEDGRQHVAQTAQFQSMKRMVTAKNQQLQDLRLRLQRYEPDYAEDDGETKNADDD